MSILHFSSTINAAGATPNFADISLAASSTILSNRSTTSGVAIAHAQLLMTKDGEAQEIINQTINTDNLLAAADYNADDWWKPKPVIDVGADFEILVTIASSVAGNSDVFVGTLGTWISLGSNSNWTLTDTGTNTENFASRTLDVSIRDTATQTIQSVGQVILQAFLLNV